MNAGIHCRWFRISIDVARLHFHVQSENVYETVAIVFAVH